MDQSHDQSHFLKRTTAALLPPLLLPSALVVPQLLQVRAEFPFGREHPHNVRPFRRLAVRCKLEGVAPTGDLVRQMPP